MDTVLNLGVLSVATFEFDRFPDLVGDDDLVAPAVVVPQLQWRARVEPFSAHDHPGARGHQVGHGFDRGDLGAGPQLSVSAQRRPPLVEPQMVDLAVEPLVGGHPDRELAASGRQPTDAGVGVAGRIRTHQQSPTNQRRVVTDTMPLSPHLGQRADRVIDHGETIVVLRAGTAVPQPAGQRQPGRPAAEPGSATGWHEAKIISQRLGLANVTVTLEAYSHVLPATDQTVAHTLANVILVGE